MLFYAKQKVLMIRKYSHRWVNILRYLRRTHKKARKPPFEHTVRRLLTKVLAPS
jgi:hypothetical protein